jgi:hypothetical protein
LYLSENSRRAIQAYDDRSHMCTRVQLCTSMIRSVAFHSNYDVGDENKTCMLLSAGDICGQLCVAHVRLCESLLEDLNDDGLFIF